MNRLTSLVVGALALLFLAAPAAAQSGCSYIVPGAVLTAAQWNACFGAKQDFLGFVPPNPSNTPSLSQNNLYTGDNFFGSGRPWCDVVARGAVGNGSSSVADLAAFNACLTALPTGGTINVPVSANGGPYCTPGLTITTNGIRINFAVAAGYSRTQTPTIASALSSCGSNLSPLTVNGPYGMVLDNPTIVGPGIVGGSAPTNPALSIANCNDCEIFHPQITGGSNGLSTTGNTSVRVYGGHIHMNYGGAQVYMDGGGVVTYFFGVVLDQSVINGCSSIAAWSATASVTAGQCLTLASGWMVVVSTSGTTGGTAPVVVAYGNAITDGTATETLERPNPTYYGAQVDSGAQFTWTVGDVSGIQTAGIALTDTQSTGGPGNVIIDSVTVQQTLGSNDILASFGAGGLRLIGTNLGACGGGVVSCTPLQIGNGFTGSIEAAASNLLQSNVAVQGASIRTLLSAPTTYYANVSTGNDADPCTSTLPCQTAQRLISLQSTIDNQGNAVTLQLASGNFPTGVVCNGPFVGGGVVTLAGTGSAPTTSINTGATGSAVTAQYGCNLTITNVAVFGNSDLIMAIYPGSMVTVSGIYYTATVGAHLSARQGAHAQSSGPSTIAGGATEHEASTNNGQLVETGQTITFNTSVNFTDAYAVATYDGSMRLTGDTYVNSGDATGPKIDIEGNAVLYTASGCASLPGSITAAANNGVYGGQCF